jgi:putative PIN family toxin of toxin-antitoxin system
MRLVLDTNVLVSALLTPGRAASRLLLEHILVDRGLTLLVDDRILAEYREVLLRPRFKFDARLVHALLEDLELLAETIDAAPSMSSSTPAQDLPFLEVAITGEADAIVTGNRRDFPETNGIEVVGPAELLARLANAG